MRLLWLDLETTGLDPKEDRILEVAAILTTKDVDDRQAILSQAVRCPSEKLDRMVPFVRDMHQRSGLLDLVPAGRALSAVEGDVIKMLRGAEGPIYLAGNSIHFDRGFVREHMRGLEKLLHYRMLDVSSLKIAWRDVLGIPDEKGAAAHRAFDDVEESIREFKRLVARVQK